MVVFCCLIYAILREDIVFIVGQSTGTFIYLRNIYFLRRERRKARERKLRLKLVRIDRRLTLFLLVYGMSAAAAYLAAEPHREYRGRYGEIAREMLASWQLPGTDVSTASSISTNRLSLTGGWLPAWPSLVSTTSVSAFSALYAALLALLFLHRTALIILRRPATGLCYVT